MKHSPAQPQPKEEQPPKTQNSHEKDSRQEPQMKHGSSRMRQELRRIAEGAKNCNVLLQKFSASVFIRVSSVAASLFLEVPLSFWQRRKSLI
jgi:hypothetical protein